MPRFTFSDRDDAQVDPFSAGDPVMPGDEPAWTGDEDHEDVGDDEGPDYAPHGEPGGEPHKRDDNYRAPTTRAHGYDAPSTEGTPARGGARRATRRRRGGCGCAALIVSMVLVVIALGGAFVEWVATEGTSLSDSISEFLDGDGVTFDDYVSDGDADWHETADELDRAAGEAVERRLDELLADPAAGPLHDRVAAYLDEELQFWEGRTAAELGIDADTWATWALTGTAYELDSVYAHDDGTGSAYFDTEARDLSGIIGEADTELSSYLGERGLIVRDGEEPAPLSEGQRAEVATLWQDACERAAGSPHDSFVSVELTRVDGVWTVDEESLDEALRSALYLL